MLDCLGQHVVVWSAVPHAQGWFRWVAVIGKIWRFCLASQTQSTRGRLGYTTGRLCGEPCVFISSDVFLKLS